MISLRASVTGDGALEKRLGPQLTREPKRRFLDRSGRVVVARAQDNLPPHIDTGRGIESLTFEIDGNTMRAGSNVDYMLYVHTGTRPHWPPIAALVPWAQRHGTTAFVVARAIARRGTEESPFLTDALDQSRSDIGFLVQVMAREIEAGG